MRREYTVAPIVVLTGACTLRPFTPSVSVAYWAQDVPAASQRTLPSMLDAVARWQLPADNVWSRWNKLTLLSSLDELSMNADVPDIRQLEVVRNAECAAGRLAVAGLPPATMLVVDVRGAGSVAFGSSLSLQTREVVAPVMTFNNWPGEDEVIPAEETLAALISMQPRLPRAGNTTPTVPVFLLDAWRLAFRDDDVDDDTVDNRYALSPADLPDVETLRAQGITQVLYIVENMHDTNTEEDDLHVAFGQYQDAGIALAMVDLGTLCSLGDSSPDWPHMVRSHGYRVHPRMTLLESPTFFQRAHGGFGGTHAGPSPWRSGGHFHSFGAGG